MTVYLAAVMNTQDSGGVTIAIGDAIFMIAKLERSIRNYLFMPNNKHSNETFQVIVGFMLRNNCLDTFILHLKCIGVFFIQYLFNI